MKKLLDTRITTILSLGAIMASLLIIRSHPATEYELSVYSNIPLIAWVLLFGGYAGGVGIMVREAFSASNSRRWYLGFFILLLSALTILVLPYLKGYAWYGSSDTMTHLGWTKDITSGGSFGRDLFYPAMHIWASSLAQISGVSPEAVIKYLPVFLPLFFSISLYLLGRSVFPERGKVILTAALGTVFVLSAGYAFAVPNAASLMLSPFILYLYFKARSDGTAARKEAYLLFLIMFLVLIPFFHPLTTLALFIFFVALEISFKVHSLFMSRRYGMSFNLLLILLATFFTWISSFSIWNSSIEKVASWLSQQIRPQLADPGSMQNMDKLGLSGFERLQLFLRAYGVDLVLIALSVIAAILILKRLRSPQYGRAFVLMGCFAFTTLFVGFFLFTRDPGIQITLNVNWIFVLSVPLAGYALYELAKFASARLSSPGYAFGLLSLMVVLVASFLFTSLYVFRSPSVYMANDQVTEARLSGIAWFFDYKDRDMAVGSIDAFPLFRFSAAIYGVAEAAKRPDMYRYGMMSNLESHFGYHVYDQVGAGYQEDIYFVISKIEELTYTRTWERYGRFTSADFAKLDKDPSLQKLYSNGDLVIRLVRGTNQREG